MLITINKLFFSLLLVMSLMACANQAVNTQRYTLPETFQSSEQASTPDAQVLVIGSISLAEFLDSERIALQMDDITLHQANEHLWAENLGQQIRRGLRSRLSKELPELLVLSDSRGLKQTAWNLQLDIEQFHGHFTGKAVTSGQWRLRDHTGELIVISPFHIETTLAADGYPALVRALGSNLDKLAEKLATEITKY